MFHTISTVTSVLGFVIVCGLFRMIMAVLSVNLVTVLFINLAVLLKGCFTRINTCLWELVQCAGEKSVGLYRNISFVKHPRPLISFNNKSGTPKSRIEHTRKSQMETLKP